MRWYFSNRFGGAYFIYGCWCSQHLKFPHRNHCTRKVFNGLLWITKISSLKIDSELTHFLCVLLYFLDHWKRLLEYQYRYRGYLINQALNSRLKKSFQWASETKALEQLRRRPQNVGIWPNSECKYFLQELQNSGM